MITIFQHRGNKFFFLPSKTIKYLQFNGDVFILHGLILRDYYVDMVSGRQLNAGNV